VRDLVELAVLVLRLADEDLERPLGVAIHRAHDDALRLLDHRP